MPNLGDLEKGGGGEVQTVNRETVQTVRLTVWHGFTVHGSTVPRLGSTVHSSTVRFHGSRLHGSTVRFHGSVFHGSTVPRLGSTVPRFHGLVPRFHGCTVRFYGFTVPRFGSTVSRFHGLVPRFHGWVLRFHGSTVPRLGSTAPRFHGLVPRFHGSRFHGSVPRFTVLRFGSAVLRLHGLTMEAPSFQCRSKADFGEFQWGLRRGSGRRTWFVVPHEAVAVRCALCPVVAPFLVQLCVKDSDKAVKPPASNSSSLQHRNTFRKVTVDWKVLTPDKLFRASMDLPCHTGLTSSIEFWQNQSTTLNSSCVLAKTLHSRWILNAMPSCCISPSTLPYFRSWLLGVLENQLVMEQKREKNSMENKAAKEHRQVRGTNGYWLK